MSPPASAPTSKTSAALSHARLLAPLQSGPALLPCSSSSSACACLFRSAPVYTYHDDGRSSVHGTLAANSLCVPPLQIAGTRLQGWCRARAETPPGAGTHASGRTARTACRRPRMPPPARQAHSRPDGSNASSAVSQTMARGAPHGAAHARLQQGEGPVAAASEAHRLQLLRGRSVLLP